MASCHSKKNRASTALPSSSRQIAPTWPSTVVSPARPRWCARSRTRSSRSYSRSMSQRYSSNDPVHSRISSSAPSRPSYVGSPGQSGAACQTSSVPPAIAKSIAASPPSRLKISNISRTKSTLDCPTGSSIALASRKLEADRVARHVALGGPRLAPARAAARADAGDVGAAVAVARVEAQAGDDHEGVAGVRVDGDPAADAGGAPLHEEAREERRGEHAASVQDVGHRARAVVGRVL